MKNLLSQCLSTLPSNSRIVADTEEELERSYYQASSEIDPAFEVTAADGLDDDVWHEQENGSSSPLLYQRRVREDLKE